MFVFTLPLLMFLMNHLSSSKSSASAPHIIFIYADDLGWNDVSMHGSPSIPTPNIDSLAASGVVLNNYYAEWYCTPSRAALMTGYYPALRLGMMQPVILAGGASGIPLNLTILPQHLKNLGYKTHMVGKWNLGAMKYEYTPTYRGFDTFFGYYNGMIDYFSFINTGITNRPIDKLQYGKDMHNGTTHLRDYVGEYATFDFTRAATDIIRLHDTDTPLFLYLSHAAVHSASQTGGPEKAPSKSVNKFQYITSLGRRIHAARAGELDDSVGEVFQTLQKRGMLDNTILVFASDNGGEVDPSRDGHSSNYPLRGSKGTPWEGGLRVPAMVWSPLLPPGVSQHLMHVSDWLPTLYTAAGGEASDLGPLDGIDQWSALKDSSQGPRSELFMNYYAPNNLSVYKRDEWKLVKGCRLGYNSWYGPTGFEDVAKPESMEGWVFKDGSVVRDILRENGQWPEDLDMDKWYESLVVRCDNSTKDVTCDGTVMPCLFNLTADPCEYNDLSEENPEVVKSLLETMDAYVRQAVPTPPFVSDPLSDPACHGFVYVPWLDPQHYDPTCNLAEGVTGP